MGCCPKNKILRKQSFKLLVLSGVSVCLLGVATAAEARRNLIPDLPSIEINLEALQRLQHEKMSAPVDSIDSGPIGQSRTGNGLPPRKVPLMNRGMVSAPVQSHSGAPTSLPFGVTPAMQPPTSRVVPGEPVVHQPKRRPAPPEPMYYRRPTNVAKPASNKPVKVVRETEVEEKPKAVAAAPVPKAPSGPKSDPFMTVPAAPPVVDEPFMDDSGSDLPDIAKLQDAPVLPTVAPPAVVPMTAPADSMDMPEPAMADMPDFGDDMGMDDFGAEPSMPKVELPPVELPPKKPAGVAPVSPKAEALPDPDFDSMSFENFPTVTPPANKGPDMGDVGTMEKPLAMPVGSPRPGVVARLPKMDAPKLPDVAPMNRDAMAVPSGAPPAADLPPPNAMPSVPALPEMPGLDDAKPLNPVPGETKMAALPQADLPVPMPSTDEVAASAETLLQIEYPQQETQVPVSMQKPLKELSKTLIQSGQSVRIMGIADPNPDQALSARRAAYSRAMLVRSFLIDNGVNHFNININTRSAEGGEMAERVDILTQ